MNDERYCKRLIFEFSYSIHLLRNALSRTPPAGFDLTAELEDLESAINELKSRAITEADISVVGLFKDKAERAKKELIKKGKRQDRIEVLLGDIENNYIHALKNVCKPGLNWVMLGQQIARAELSGSDSGEELREVWKAVCGEVNQKPDWLTEKISKIGKNKLGWLRDSVSSLFKPAWRWDESVPAVNDLPVPPAQYRVLVVLRMADGTPMTNKDLIDRTGNPSAPNSLSSIRMNDGLKDLISPDAPARWTDMSFPKPRNSDMPRDLARKYFPNTL